MRLIQAPSKLQDLACFAIIKGIWDRSQLSQVLADNVDRNGVRTDICHIQKVHKEILIKTQENILKLNLPYNWKLKLCAGVEGLDTEINKFCKELVGELRDCTVRENINICCTSIVFNYLTYLDKRSTILNILYKKDFNISFKKSFLSHNCIGPDSLNLLPDHILKGKQEELSQMFVKRKLQNVRDYWENRWNHAQNNYGCRASLLHFVSFKKDLAVIDFFFQYLDAKEMEENVECALKYNIIYQQSERSPDVLILFHEYLNEDVWCRILERNFLKTIESLIRSWRHRQHIVLFYRHAANTFLTLEDFKFILEYYWYVKDTGPYEYSDIMYNVILKIWNVTPLEYLMDVDVMYRVVPELVNFKVDFKLFCMMLHVYQQVEMRQKMLSHMILYVVARGEDVTLLPILVSEVKQSKVLDEQHYDDRYSSLLNEDALKRYFKYFCKNKFRRFHIFYERVSEFALKSKERVKVFKENLLSDDFVLEYCQRLKYFGRITLLDDLILWCNEGDTTKFKEFTEKKEKLIHKIVKGLLLDVKCRLLRKQFNLNKAFFNKADAIKKELMESSQFRNEIFRSYLTFSDLDEIETDNPQTKRWIEEFLMSDEGLQCVIRLITYIDSVDEDRSLREDFTRIWWRYVLFKSIWLGDDGLTLLRLDERLAVYGHPNLKLKEYKLRDKYSLTTVEMSTARRLVDANYRVFRAILRGLLPEYQDIKTLLDHTAASVNIAREVGLVVDVVV